MNIIPEKNKNLVLKAIGIIHLVLGVIFSSEIVIDFLSGMDGAIYFWCTFLLLAVFFCGNILFYKKKKNGWHIVNTSLYYVAVITGQRAWYYFKLFYDTEQRKDGSLLDLVNPHSFSPYHEFKDRAIFLIVVLGLIGLLHNKICIKEFKIDQKGMIVSLLTGVLLALLDIFYRLYLN